VIVNRCQLPWSGHPRQLEVIQSPPYLHNKYKVSQHKVSAIKCIQHVTHTANYVDVYHKHVTHHLPDTTLRIYEVRRRRHKLLNPIQTREQIKKAYKCN
jgi:transcriptional accessory protein Tex/SPT6